MIEVTRLGGCEVVVNAEMIEFIESTPDTVLSLVSGKKIVVTEDVEVVKERVINYKRELNKVVD
ncbi:flagellar FlbD family protein [Acetohalobium arabaticum]|uniref:Flagellar FlbD family protein n=1 Tax=Acetohalobium arabaticum (strain ATCC 49924 / DSM 5501 / Z-7288) TaxID=574087 RepID=D9QRK0_ACEAZ|nr:flagellar FlbD family protein [Acetohalobium arabaticum]ADL13141.1 flagellar FlbD family protein [Acetohalobium arabaticum DSM 5501]